MGSGRARAAGDVDAHVGERLRALREARGWNQTDLGEIADISFQQVQKYEKGTNRISAGRLLEFAACFQVPIGGFFVGLESTAVLDDGAVDKIGELAAFARSPEGRQLLTDFAKIDSAASRRELLKLVKTLAASER